MREYLITAARHIAGAAVGALVAFAAGQGFDGLDPSLVTEITDGLSAFLTLIALGVYALVEKALKPVAERLLGSLGS